VLGARSLMDVLAAASRGLMSLRVCAHGLRP